MRSSELQPSHNNLFETFMSDTIGRDKDVIAFAEILNNLEGSYSIALEGNWGSGKTFFVKQTKMLLDANNEHLHSLPDDEKAAILEKWARPSGDRTAELIPQMSVYYDAWENDNDEDPILSLVYSIMESVDADSPFSNDASIVGVAASFLSVLTGKNLSGLVDCLRGKNPLDSLRKHKNVETEVNRFLDSLLSERGNRLVVFVDELDRCRPCFAVKLLERIKHFFSNERITFVFSINFSELQHTIKKHYGDGFNACRYLDRFFDLRVSLPPADMTRFYVDMDFSSGAWTYDSVCRSVIEKYGLSLRETARYIQLAKIAAYRPTHSQRHISEGKAAEFCLLYIVPIMIGLKITDFERYEAFVSGKDVTPLIEVLGEKKDNNFSDLIDSKMPRVSEDEWVITSVEEKLKEVYDAVFVNSYSVSPYCKQIGKLQFGEEVRKFVMGIVGLFSRYADFSG